MNVKKTVITAALILTLIPIQHVKALSSEKHGYGQGTATDSQTVLSGRQTLTLNTINMTLMH